jgi:benzylsuccinate CoA-transferase BbsF subunit
MDAATGATGALATLAALRRRDQTGSGQLVEVAQTENLLNHLGGILIEAASTGTRHATTGNRHTERAPRGVYRCRDADPGEGGAGRPGAGGRDRWVAIDVHTDDEWEGLRRAMGEPTWAAEPRFATTGGRLEHHDELDARITAWTSGLNHIEVFHVCQEHGVRAGAVLTESECSADPHLRDRGLFRPNGNREIGTYDFPGHLWRWDGPDLAWGPPPLLGERVRAPPRRCPHLRRLPPARRCPVLTASAVSRS